MIHNRKNIAITIVALLAVGLAAITGCDKGYDCELDNTSYDNIAFYTIEDGKEEAYIYQSPLTVSLMVNGEESVMINHVVNTGNVSLPMSYTQERDTVIFRYDDGLCDSLYIDHTNTPYYQSMECGTLMFHKLEGLKSTNVWIEDAAIVNDIVNFEGHENIKIYFYK